MSLSQNPPRNGEGDRQPEAGGGGVPPAVLIQPIKAVRRARQLRREMSLPEVLLWQQLRMRPDGFIFRKQVPQHPYTLDFACLKARLVIEVDGEAHDRGDRPDRDESRDTALATLGFATLRIAAADVLKNMEGCVVQIVTACAERGPSTTGFAGGPQHRVDRAPGTILDCRGQSNPALRSGEDLQ